MNAICILTNVTTMVLCANNIVKWETKKVRNIMKSKNIKRNFALFMVLCMCFCMVPTTVFAAEPTPSEGKDYLNYEFPEGAVVLYQSKDGVIYTTPSMDTDSEQMSFRSVEYNQVWVKAGDNDAGSFNVTNPHPFGGNGFGRLRLESEASNVSMDVQVFAGMSTIKSGIVIGVGEDVTFDFNTWSSELTIKYYTRTTSSSHGMRLNCWLS